MTQACDTIFVQLVKATKSFQGSNTESSVTENELLVVKNARSKITGINVNVVK